MQQEGKSAKHMTDTAGKYSNQLYFVLLNPNQKVLHNFIIVYLYIDKVQFL